MRCDLHVHTLHSGRCTVPVARRFCRESYNEPLAVYERLKSLGMDLVTVTDHDSIDAAEQLRRYPDFFVSEEVTATLPSGTEAHIAVYGVNDRQHVEIQARRDDFARLLAYFHEQRLLFGINHAFSSLTGWRDQTDYSLFADEFPVWEIRNSAMLRRANDQAARFAHKLGKAVSGGSDSHTMRTLGNCYTTVPGARNAREYLDGLRRGRGAVEGAHGSWGRVFLDVATIAYNLFREKPHTWAISPSLLALAPVILGTYSVELLFAFRAPAMCAQALKRCPVTLALLEEAALA
jgi:predicted metal-dependent phosphoesterase TrpH